MSVWEALARLDAVIDKSDPDTSLPQIQHALQTAESIRKDYPDSKDDWFPLVGLIHDLGKVLSTITCGLSCLCVMATVSKHCMLP